MVTPAPADLQVAGREALTFEARALRQRNRRLIPRLDVRLQAVQAQLDERDPQHQLDPLTHVPLASVLLGGRVAEVGTLQRAPRDLGDVEEADDLVVARPAHEQRLKIWATRVLEVRSESRRVRRGTGP